MGLAVLLFDCESSLELFAPFAVWDLNHLILCFVFLDSWVFLVFWDSSPAPLIYIYSDFLETLYGAAFGGAPFA